MKFYIHKNYELSVKHLINIIKYLQVKFKFTHNYLTTMSIYLKCLFYYNNYLRCHIILLIYTRYIVLLAGVPSW